MIGQTSYLRCAVGFVAAALIIVVTGCTSETLGQASSVAATGTGGSEPPAGTSAVENAPSFEEELASVLPCDVLDDEQVADLGFDPTTADFREVGILYTCQYTVTPTEFPMMSISVDVDKALDDLNLTNYNSTNLQVGSLRSLLITDDRDPQMCQISMELAESARATVRVMFEESQAAACDTAERIAAVVESELPREAR